MNHVRTARPFKGIRAGLLAGSLAAAAALTLSACDGTNDRVDGSSGGNGADNGGGDGTPTTQLLKGVLLKPESQTKSAVRLKARNTVQTKQDDPACPDTPPGYAPLDDEELVFLDAGGNETGESTTTDDCGFFEDDVSEAVTTVRAEPAGLRPIETEVSVFVPQDPNAPPARVSTISDQAEYTIPSFARQGDGRFVFTVRDTESNRPVLGLPPSAFTLDVGGSEVDLESVRVAAQTGEAAGVSLVLDASGSMSANVAQNEDGDSLTRWHLTRDAAQLFLDEKAPNDETAFVIFDRDVDLINDDFIADRWVLEDADGNSVDYSFSPSGFSSETDDLRLIADAFSPYSTVYSNPRFGTEQAPHPDTPDITITNSYVWGGRTALWDAVEVGIDSVLVESAASRKAVITMGDGLDNESDLTLDELIDLANNEGVPVYSIYFGQNADPDDPNFDSAAEDLQRLGEETGGGYTGVNDADADTEILAAFESLQVGLVFQYLAALVDNDQVQGGDTVTLTLEYNQLTTTREFTVPN